MVVVIVVDVFVVFVIGDEVEIAGKHGGGHGGGHEEGVVVAVAVVASEVVAVEDVDVVVAVVAV